MRRAELYERHDTQALLNKIVSDEIADLEPTFDPKLGYRYPIVEKIIDDPSKSRDFLDKLFKAGILEREIYDKVIRCPKCDSADISVHYCCPYCKSFNIKRSSLIEHVKCGYMDIEENFQEGKKLACPKCHEEMKKSDVDYREAGIWCTCRDCEKSFDIPNTAHFCRNCNANSSFEDAVIEDVYIYRLKEGIAEEASAGWVVVGPIKDFLEESGFRVESPAFMQGKSGANHMFDIAVSKTGKKGDVTVIDLASSIEDSVPEQPVIALFAKIFDVSPSNAYLIAIPRLSENGKKMAKLYNIEVVEAENRKEAERALKNRLASKE
ncbi:MAG: hypothetical protein PVH12_02940 [Candidatus Bathyarchaeota archaeon]|jgi:hypothetical protein